jgi:hypothetical protein
MKKSQSVSRGVAMTAWILCVWLLAGTQAALRNGLDHNIVNC